ncbi:MAG TPA: hypothetical protein VEU33_22285 [Archangium sp.]|nr:hypothetical protein [Archangium sp.]
MTQPIPEVYIDFVRFMGHGLGELVLYHGADFHIRSVITYHANKYPNGPPKRYFLIGFSEEEPYENFYLDSEEQGEPNVVRFSTPHKKELWPEFLQQQEWLAYSLTELLFVKAYYEYHVSTFANEQHLDAPEEVAGFIEKVAPPLTLLGFQRHPLSSKGVAYYERGDITAVAVHDLGRTPYLHLVAHNRSELRKVTDILAERLHLIPRRA